MLRATEQIIDAGLAGRAFTEADIEQLLDGTAASRYGRVNKAIKRRDLIVLRRGLYILGDKYRAKDLSKYYLAHRIVSFSYVSCETALAYHGCIPERVASVISIIAQGRNRKFETELGDFYYYRIPINDYEFLTGVNREAVNESAYMMASPLRALADLVYIRKLNWQGLSFLTDSLRIEEDILRGVNPGDLVAIKDIFKSKRVLHFLTQLQEELYRYA